MKILIVDNQNRDRGFIKELNNSPEVIIQNTNFSELDFNNCKIIFKHDNFNYELPKEIKSQIIFIEFSGGGLKNEILDDSEGWKLKAKIESPSQINNGLNIINKQVFTKEDVEMILNFDSELESFLEHFASANPFEDNEVLREAKKALNDYLKRKQ